MPLDPDLAPDASAPRGSVLLGGASDAPRSQHEACSHQAIARELAALLGYDYCGLYAPVASYNPPLYFVPGDVLVGLDAAAACGIHGEGDLFGGVVSHAVLATKAITHPLIDEAAHAPAGWPPAFAERVNPVTLPGYTAFAREDARRAGLRLLADGPVRIKPAHTNAGRGQRVADSAQQLEAILAQADPLELARAGLVLETDLLDVTTFSVGQVRVGEHAVAYVGTQWLTRDNHGDVAYGGSELQVCRGGFDALLETALPADAREAIDQAQRYDRAAHACLPMFASRRNYDVARGVDRHGRAHMGVLEASWRIGGASGAEVAALRYLRDHPGCTRLRACALERYGEDAAPPAHARVLFHGVDPQVGPLLKCVTIEQTHGHA